MDDLRSRVPIRASAVALICGLGADVVVALASILGDPSPEPGYDGLITWAATFLSFALFAVLAVAAALLAWPIARALVDVARPSQLALTATLAGLAVLVSSAPIAAAGALIVSVFGDTRIPAAAFLAAALSALVTAVAIYIYLRCATANARRPARSR